MNRSPIITLSLSLALTLAATAILNAQEQSPFKTGYLYDFKSDIDDGGKVSRHFFHATGGLPVVNTDDLFAAIGASYRLNSYNFQDGTPGSLAALDPWHNVHSIHLGAFIDWTLNDEWKLFALPNIRSTGESGANFSDTIGGGGLLGASYKFGENLTLGPGIGYITQLQDDPSIFPIVLVDWKLNGRLSLTTGPSVGATLGPGLSLNYDIDDDLRLIFGARYEKLRFRLDENNAAAPGGVGEERGIPIFGALSWQAADHLLISFVGGLKVGNSLRLEEADDRGLIKTDYDPAPFIGANLSLTF
ncbi:MAG: DUF6268 family outer membrane beta-barrel protein [Verrucomicrobiota bacterium]